MTLMLSFFTFWLAFITLFHIAAANVLVLRENNVTAADYVSYGAFFGSVVDSDGILGYLVYADPPEACDTIVSRSNYDKNVTILTRKWIVLIARGKCSFSHKVWIAQEAGYDAAIVHNVGSESLIHMSSSAEGDNVRIPSVFVGDREGLELAAHYLWNSSYYVVVTDEFPVININTILLPFAIVVGVCFLMLFGFVVGRWIRERRRQQRHRLPKRELRKIPTKKYAEDDKYDVCAICLEQFTVGEKIRVLPCDHLYHIKCIDPWLLNSKRVCPVCKQKVIPGDHSDSEDDSEQPVRSTSAAGPSGAGTSGFSINNNNDSVPVIQREVLVQQNSNSLNAADSNPTPPNSISSLPVYADVTSGAGTFATAKTDAENAAEILTDSSSLLQQLVASHSSSISDESTMPLLSVGKDLPSKDDERVKMLDAAKKYRGRSASQTHDTLKTDFAFAAAPSAAAEGFERSTSSSASDGKKSHSSHYVNKSFDASFDTDSTPAAAASSSSSSRGNRFTHRKHGSLSTTSTTIVADINPTKTAERIAARIGKDKTDVKRDFGHFGDKLQQQSVILAQRHNSKRGGRKQRYDSTVSTDTNQSYIVGDDNAITAVANTKGEDDSNDAETKASHV